jgi:hypothetical protein
LKKAIFQVFDSQNVSERSGCSVCKNGTLCVPPVVIQTKKC